MSQAQVLGERANQSRLFVPIFFWYVTSHILCVCIKRNTINYLKNSIEAIRRERSPVLYAVVVNDLQLYSTNHRAMQGLSGLDEKKDGDNVIEPGDESIESQEELAHRLV